MQILDSFIIFSVGQTLLIMSMLVSSLSRCILEAKSSCCSDSYIIRGTVECQDALAEICQESGVLGV